MTTLKIAGKYVGALATGLLLASLYAPLEWGLAAWIALVPLLLVLRDTSSLSAARLGLVAGLAFWLCSLAWLSILTIPGWIALAAYCALYPMFFAIGASWAFRHFARRRWFEDIGIMLWLAVLWVALEYGRATLCTGFPWNALGVSQYRSLTVIQIARLGGVYLVSGLIVWVNAAVALTIFRYIDRPASPTRHFHYELMIGFLAVALAVSYGWRVLGAPVPAVQKVRIAVVQPNIPQEQKWVPETVDLIYSRLLSLTQVAVRVPGLHLIVWPETAVPDDIRDSAPSYDLVYQLVTNGVPILVGSMDTEWRDEAKPLFYNSSFLFGTDGAIVQGYDKRHLVIFGEYIPLQNALPFVKALTPIQESFTPGRTSTVFRLEEPAVAFSSLICFEDTLAPLARESVRNGARLLINQTNDGWFDPSSASRQHMAQCVFRCVENGVPAVRSANTGVSCSIDRSGRVYDVLKDDRGHCTVIAGVQTTTVAVPGEDMPRTFYTVHGDVFAGGCAALAVLCLVMNLARRLRCRGVAPMPS